MKQLTSLCLGIVLWLLPGIAGERPSFGHPGAVAEVGWSFGVPAGRAPVELKGSRDALRLPTWSGAHGPAWRADGVASWPAPLHSASGSLPSTSATRALPRRLRFAYEATAPPPTLS